MAQSTLAASLMALVTDIQRDFALDGVRLADMRRAGSLETQRIASFEPEREDEPSNEWPLTIERIEHQPIRAVSILPARPGESRLRYFLDGSQKTVLVWRVGVVPIVSAFAVAAVLIRSGGEGAIVPGTLKLDHNWLIPEHARAPELDRLRDRLLLSGAKIVDPLADRLEPDGSPGPDYLSSAENYATMISAAQEKAGALRGDLERDILGEWANSPERETDNGFIVVDGKLRKDIPNAVGLVKSLDMQHLAGNEAEVLFGLPAGSRTSAFRYVGRQSAARDSGDSKARTMWYIRFWDAAGMDARHSLVRIEAPHAVEMSAEIDLISSWLMAERVPRATQDARWATLLYPIHLLEEILKRRIAGALTGWPS